MPRLEAQASGVTPSRIFVASISATGSRGPPLPVEMHCALLVADEAADGWGGRKDGAASHVLLFRHGTFCTSRRILQTCFIACCETAPTLVLLICLCGAVATAVYQDEFRLTPFHRDVLQAGDISPPLCSCCLTN